MCPNSITKHCPTCDVDKPLNEFNKNRTKRDGLAYSCRECMREALRQWREANPEKYQEAIHRSKAKKPEKYRAHKQSWAVAHPSKVRDSRQRYANTHPYDEVKREYFRKRYQQNKQQIQTRTRQYQRTHLEGAALRQRRRRLLKGHKRIHGWPVMRAWFGDRCLCCGATHRIEADHVIPLSKGGSDTLANLQPLCRTCNANKATQIIDYRDPVLLKAFLDQL